MKSFSKYILALAALLALTAPAQAQLSVRKTAKQETTAKKGNTTNAPRLKRAASQSSHQNQSLRLVTTPDTDEAAAAPKAQTLSQPANQVAASSSSSSAITRGGARKAKDAESLTPGVTDRMRSRFQSSEPSEADRMWMRVVYRELETKNPKNATLYFPEEIVDGNENLFRILMRLLADNSIPAYEYLDGKEIFSDQYRLKVRDMLDRFHVLYTDAKGSTDKAPRFTIEESDVPANEVLSYYILERWEFDSRANKTRQIVEAICPVLHRSDDFGGEPIRYPMFWVKMDDIRPYLAQQPIFVDDDNNLPRYNYDDFFALNMYDGDIYKTRNLTNKSMMQLFPDPDERKHAQDSIQQRLASFDSKAWVPSREEVIAAREAREAAEAAKAEAEAAGTDIASRDTNSDEVAPKASNSRTARATRSSRGSAKASKAKAPKKQPKATKPKKSSSSAVRSVRRRK